MARINVPLTNFSIAYPTDFLSTKLFPTVPVTGSNIYFRKGGLGVATNENTVKVKLTTANASINSAGIWDTSATFKNGDTFTFTAPLSYGDGNITGYSLGTTGSTMPWRGAEPIWGINDEIKREESDMNIRAAYTRVKDGYLAQVYNGSVIVWESEKAYRTMTKAYKVANKKINETVENIFNE